MLVTLRQLQYIIAVSETGSFSKAADVVSAEQSTVSQQIRVLEDRLGVLIFDRKSLPVKLTPEGEKIVLQAKEIIDKVEGMLLPFKVKPNRFGWFLNINLSKLKIGIFLNKEMSFFFTIFALYLLWK